MVEILPLKILTDEDGSIFGSLNVALAKLKRVDIPVANAIVVTAPNIRLKAILEHFDFGYKDTFEQSLTLVKKEINSTPIPDVLDKEISGQSKFLLNGQVVRSKKDLWLRLLSCWLDQIKQKLWKDGFYKGITEGLDPQIVIFVKKVEAFGQGYFDFLSDDSVLDVKYGRPHPNDLKKLDQVIREANKKLFIPHEYEWVIDNGVKITKVLPHTPPAFIPEVFTQNPPCGFAKLPLGRFIVLTFFGSLVWSYFLAWIGFTLGQNWHSIGPYFHKADAVIVILIIGAVLFYIYHKIRK
jgi:hypothetical protein